MNLRILKRRAEMLDAVSMGLHPSAVVAQLAEKSFGNVSENTTVQPKNTTVWRNLRLVEIFPATSSFFILALQLL